YEAFQYFNFDFDGSTMVIASRTAFDVGDTYKPPRGHDSNLITFHKIENFRDLVPNHVLKLSGGSVLRYEKTQHTDAPLGSFALGNIFAGAALTSPNGMGQTAAGDVYIRETAGRILHFDAAGNFIETNSAAPVFFQSSNLTVTQPANGECSWVRSGSGDWFEPLSWYYWGRPDTTEETAVFGSAAAAAATVNIPSETQIWNFNTDGDKEGWVISNTNYWDVAATNGLLQGTATTTNSVYIFRTDRFFYGSTVPEVRIRLRAGTNCPVVLYWGTTAAEAYPSSQSLTQSYTNNGAFQDFVFPLAGNTNWDGKVITRLRFDPRVPVGAAARSFDIDSITVPRESCRMKGLRFRNPNPYTLSGGGQLRIESGSGPGTIEVLQGKHTNNVELVLGSDTDMVLTNNTSLHLKLGINLNGKTLHVSGAGKLLMQDSLVMNGGTLAVSGETPLTFTNNTTGTVLNGTLQFMPEGTFSPSGGDSFALLDNENLLGTKRFTAVSLPALPAGLKWNTNSLYSAGNVSVETVQHTLAVSTVYGQANPAAGTNTYNYGTNLTAALTDSPVANGAATQYVCRGWSGTGSVPAGGTSTNTGSFTLTTNSTVIWLWTTNYWLDTGTNGNGSVNVADGWRAAGSNVIITAAPGAGWHFTAWSGGTNGCALAGNVITAPMTMSRTITAGFAIDRHALTVTTPYGAASPAAGTSDYDEGTVLTATLAGSPVADGATTQYVCNGWSGTGNVPAGGSTTNTGSFVLTADSTVTWLWTTNYWLDTAATPGGSVDVSNGWKPGGVSVQITATPDAGSYFTGWSGNTAGDTNSARLTLPMNQARSVTANFASYVKNALPFEETFEEFSAGGGILVAGNTNGWYGSTNTFAAVTNFSYAWTNVFHPVESAAHTKVLHYSRADLTARFETNTAPVNTTVDFMFSRAEVDSAVPDTNLFTSSQTTLYVDTNGFLNVWYGRDNTGTNNAWMTYTNTPIGTSDWARVTVALDYTTDVQNGGHYFMVTLNGVTLRPATSGYSRGAGTFNADTNGTWLLAANPAPRQIQAFILSGSGMLDDLVITTNTVTDFFPPATVSYTLTGSATGNGTVSPASTNVLSGSSANFVITASNYYRIASLSTNGT
ncbi:MAG: hypothetical protein WC334_09515, partial [Kiritimatiellales bacterium]